MKNNVSPEKFLALFQIYSFEKIIDTWLAEQNLSIPMNLRPAYEELMQRLKPLSRNAWGLYKPPLYDSLKKILFPEWFINNQEIKDEFKVLFFHLETDSTFLQMKEKYGKEAYLRVMYPEQFTPEALAEKAKRQEELATAEQLPPRQKYARLYELAGEGAVIRAYKKTIATMGVDEAAIDFAYQTLKKSLQENGITLSENSWLEIAMDTALCFPSMTRDNTTYYFC